MKSDSDPTSVPNIYILDGKKNPKKQTNKQTSVPFFFHVVWPIKQLFIGLKTTLDRWNIQPTFPCNIISFFDNFGQAKIGNFDKIILSNKDVSGSQVTMYIAFRFQVIHALCNLQNRKITPWELPADWSK